MALLAKYDIDTEDIQDCAPRPKLDFTPEEAPEGQRETRDAKTARNERRLKKQQRLLLKMK